MVSISVVHGDIVDRPCDLLILKYANGLHGVDREISSLISFESFIPEDEHRFARGGSTIKARKILYLGVGPLDDFRYEKIRAFAARAMGIAARGNGRAEAICTPIHGPGYGLDEKEAFFSLLSGFHDAIELGRIPTDLSRIEIVERNPNRALRLKQFMSELMNERYAKSSIKQTSKESFDMLRGGENYHEDFSDFGAASEEKHKLFVAMPFGDEYTDVWDVSIQDSCAKVGILCEIIKEKTFTGDILQNILLRIENSNGLLALLDGANPNVFLEIGYAWALKKPTVLMSKVGSALPFDIRGQKCIIYRNIAHLREELIKELGNLKEQGAFRK